MYHELCKTFSKICYWYYDLISKFHVRLKSLLPQALSKPVFHAHLTDSLSQQLVLFCLWPLHTGWTRIRLDQCWVWCECKLLDILKTLCLKKSAHNKKACRIMPYAKSKTTCLQVHYRLHAWCLSIGVFRRQDLFVLSCMICLFIRHDNFMCDFFKQWGKLACHL